MRKSYVNMRMNPERSETDSIILGNVIVGAVKKSLPLERVPLIRERRLMHLSEVARCSDGSFVSFILIYDVQKRGKPPSLFYFLQQESAMRNNRYSPILQR